MTQAEKDVLKEIVRELGKLTNAVIALQEKVNMQSLVQLSRSFDTLSRKIDALPSR
jgi:hypothetical protein